MTALNDTLIAAINNPECSIIVGGYIGAFSTLRIMLIISILYFIFKAADKLALEPILHYIKRKFKKLRDKNEI